MKSTDLRIGNWIMSPDGKYVQVKNIQEKSFNQLIDGDGVVGSYKLEVYSGIPLTEEWLLKFGFSDKGYKSGYIGKDFKSSNIILDFVLSKPFLKGEWNNCYTFDLNGCRFVKLEFVHELQNLWYVFAKGELGINL